MKKYLSIALLTLFIIPSVALASWWNPFSWKVFHKKEVVPVVQQTQTEEQKTPEEKISELQKQLDDFKKQQPVPVPIKTTSPFKEVKKIVPGVDNLYKIQQSAQIVDVCLNIEGIQSKIPDGYSLVSGDCNLIPIKDYCLNIAGVQSKIPEGMVFDKGVKKCLTENEIEAIEKTNSEKLHKESSCLSSKQTVVKLQEKLIEINDIFQKKIDTTNTNPNGAMQGGINDMISSLEKEQSIEKNKIWAQIYLFQSKVQLYCNN